MAAIAAVVLVLSMALPWYQKSVRAGGQERVRHRQPERVRRLHVRRGGDPAGRGRRAVPDLGADGGQGLPPARRRRARDLARGRLGGAAADLARVRPARRRGGRASRSASSGASSSRWRPRRRWSSPARACAPRTGPSRPTRPRTSTGSRAAPRPRRRASDREPRDATAVTEVLRDRPDWDGERARRPRPAPPPRRRAEPDARRAPRPPLLSAEDVVGLSPINRLLGATAGRGAFERHAPRPRRSPCCCSPPPPRGRRGPGRTLSAPHTFVDDPGRGRLGRAGARSRLALPGRRSATAARSGSSGATRAPGAGGFGDGRRRSCPPRASGGRGATVDGSCSHARRRRAAGAERLPGAGDTVAARLAVRFGTHERALRQAAHDPPRRAVLDPARLAGRQRRAATPRSPGSRTAACAPTASTSRCAAPATASGSRAGSPRAASAASRRRSASAATRSWPGTPAACCARASSPRRAAASAPPTRSAPSPPSSPTCTRSCTPSGRAVLAWSAQFRSEGGDRGPVLLPGRDARGRARARFARARLLETIPAPRLRRARPRARRRRRQRRASVTIAWRGAGGVRASRGGAPAPDAVGAGHDRGALRPRGRARTGGWSRSGTAASTTPASVVRAAVAGGVGQPFGPPEDVSPAGAMRASGTPAFFARPARRDRVEPLAAAGRVAQAYVR